MLLLEFTIYYRTLVSVLPTHDVPSLNGHTAWFLEETDLEVEGLAKPSVLLFLVNTTQFFENPPARGAAVL
jgi:hypothetical protein